MRKGTFFLGFLLASSVVAAPVDFNPKEPISLDLKDAKITDVVQTLGALANLPVLIDPDVQGTVTIHLHDPYDVVLEKLSTATGLSIRIENGRLVAISRPFKMPPVAPVLPDEYRNARRILLSEYHRAASNPPPLFVRLTWRGSEICYRANFRSGEGRLAEMPVPGSDTATVVVALVDYDPISRTSFVAVEGPGGKLERIFAIGSGAVSFSSGLGEQSLRVVTSTEGGSRTCFDANTRNGALGSTLVVLRLEGRPVGEGNSRLLFAPRVQTKSGGIFKALSGGAPDPDSGEHRGFFVAGYVARDGAAAGLLFKARAVWSDPKDGEEYYFTQPVVDAEARFVPLTREGVVAARLSPGVATAEAVELRVYGEE